jgi:excisionase family DNA binding protein
MDDLLTVKQVSILLKVHPLTVRRYINEGKLKAVKVGGNVRISQQDLRNFSEIYSPNAKTTKSNSAPAPTTAPFDQSDAFFRLKGRGLSIDNFNK